MREIEQLVDPLVGQPEALRCLLVSQAHAILEYLRPRDLKNHVSAPPHLVR